jgi:hypothetical protein
MNEIEKERNDIEIKREKFETEKRLRICIDKRGKGKLNRLTKS